MFIKRQETGNKRQGGRIFYLFIPIQYALRFLSHALFILNVFPSILLVYIYSIVVLRDKRQGIGNQGQGTGDQRQGFDIYRA